MVPRGRVITFKHASAPTPAPLPHTASLPPTRCDSEGRYEKVIMFPFRNDSLSGLRLSSPNGITPPHQLSYFPPSRKTPSSPFNTCSSLFLAASFRPELCHLFPSSPIFISLPFPSPVFLALGVAGAALRPHIISQCIRHGALTLIIVIIYSSYYVKQVLGKPARGGFFPIW